MGVVGIGLRPAKLLQEGVAESDIAEFISKWTGEPYLPVGLEDRVGELVGGR